VTSSPPLRRVDKGFTVDVVPSRQGHPLPDSGVLAGVRSPSGLHAGGKAAEPAVQQGPKAPQ
jgi:hypothetical protein